jgi:pyrimidine deaminase RibD-like protein
VAVLGHSSAIVAINAVVTISPVSHVVGQTPPAPTLLSPAEIDGVAHAVCAGQSCVSGTGTTSAAIRNGGSRSTFHPSAR